METGARGSRGVVSDASTMGQGPQEAFAAGVGALAEGRAQDAIASFETVADSGLVDASASYDRGLAYALRVRIGAEVPGDLGRAAHGFEEARDLATDQELAGHATQALAVVRAEVARRRARSGDPVEVEQSPPLGLALARALPEQGWAALALAMSCALGVAVLVRAGARARRVRVGASLASGVGALVLGLALAGTAVLRHDRLERREGVVVAAAARLAEPTGLVRQGVAPLPEGARVDILEGRGALTRVRWGKVEGWVPASSLRPLAKAP